jgi:uncharacterized protein (TIGR01244 family)
MQDCIKVSDRITVGAQPTPTQIERLAQEGFKTIVNLRTSGEEDQPLSPDAEGDRVRQLGLHYLHIPVSAKALGAEQVDQFRQELSRLPAPMFVHCATGKRSGAFVMMHMAVEAGMSGDETLEKAAQMGFECDVPELKEFVENYVDRHRT